MELSDNQPEISIPLTLEIYPYREFDGLTNMAIAAEIGIAKHTVGKWCERFARQRMDGLLDEHRPGAPR